MPQSLHASSPQGLSPHMRGKLQISHQERQSIGSIPAHAGETGNTVWNGALVGVYPRTCGGNVTGAFGAVIVAGLSPHMRGKLQITPDDTLGEGSIPAHAGETVSYLPR